MNDYEAGDIYPEFLWRRRIMVDPVPWPWFKDLDNPVWREVLASYVEFEKTSLAAQAEFDTTIMTARRAMLDQVGAAVRRVGSRVTQK